MCIDSIGLSITNSLTYAEYPWVCPNCGELNHLEFLRLPTPHLTSATCDFCKHEVNILMEE